jgi:hypothetical protein
MYWCRHRKHEIAKFNSTTTKISPKKYAGDSSVCQKNSDRYPANSPSGWVFTSKGPEQLESARSRRTGRGSLLLNHVAIERRREYNLNSFDDLVLSTHQECTEGSRQLRNRRAPVRLVLSQGIIDESMIRNIITTDLSRLFARHIGEDLISSSVRIECRCIRPKPAESAAYTTVPMTEHSQICEPNSAKGSRK